MLDAPCRLPSRGTTIGPPSRAVESPGSVTPQQPPDRRVRVLPPGPSEEPRSTATLVNVARGRPTVSFELYPPRTPAREAVVWDAVERLAAARPDFFSVTYGASGSSRDASRALVRRILTETTVAPIAHLTCVGATREELARLVGELIDDGVRDFLALRGDPPAGTTTWVPQPDGLNRASELVALIRRSEERRVGKERR